MGSAGARDTVWFFNGLFHGAHVAKQQRGCCTCYHDPEADPCARGQPVLLRGQGSVELVEQCKEPVWRGTGQDPAILWRGEEARSQDRRLEEIDAEEEAERD